MSELIHEETGVLRVGALSGPNLAREIMDGQTQATVIASRFDEVIQGVKMPFGVADSGCMAAMT